MKKLFIGVIVFMMTFNGYAQLPSISSNTTSDTIQLFPITVIALKRLNSSVAHRQEIKPVQRLEHDGANLLSQLPEFSSIKKSGNYGFDPVFRGFKYDQLIIVINGSTGATAACPNRMDPPTSQIAPNMIERIEVFKGPYSLRYGNAFGATLNFIMKEPQFEDKSVEGRIASSFETNGNIARTEGRFSLLHPKSAADLYFSFSEGDDYTDGASSLVQSDFSRLSLGLNYAFKLGAHQQLNLSSTLNRAENVDFPAQMMDLIFDQTFLFNVKHSLKSSGDKSFKGLTTEVFGSFVDHQMSNELRTLNPRMLDAVADAETKNYGVRIESRFTEDDKQFFLGSDYRLEEVQGFRMRDFLMGPNKGKLMTDNLWQGGQIEKGSLFLEYSQKTKQTRFILSTRLESNSALTETPDDRFMVTSSFVRSIQQFNPSFSAGILKRTSERVELGAWLGRSQRSGSLSERFINFLPIGTDPYELVGNPSLAAEANHQLDLTLDYSQDQLNLKIDLFSSILNNYITSIIDQSLNPRVPSAPGVRRFVNAEQALKLGFETSLNHQISTNLQQQLALSYTYAKDLNTQDPLPEIAPLDVRYRLVGFLFDQRLKPEASFRFVGQQNRIATVFGETKTDSFSLIDFNLNYQIGPKIEAQFSLKNLTNELYYEHLTRSVSASTNPIYAQGRSAQVSLVWNI
jgi:iron complex outermembrane recepter protein